MRQITAFGMAAVLLLASVAAAQPRVDGEARAREVAPFVGAETALVVHVDMRAVDMDAIQRWVEQIIQQTVPENEREAAIRDMREGMDEARTWINDFRQAGGQRVYVVAAGDMQSEPALVAPLAEGADAQRLTRVMRRMAGAEIDDEEELDEEEMEEQWGPQVVQLHNALVMASQDTIRQLRQQQPQARPELAEALGAPATAAVQVALMPTQQMRRMVQEEIGALPEELGGGPVARISDNIRWLAVGANAPPQGMVRLVIQSPAADGAQALSQAINQALELLRQMPEMAELAQALAPQIQQERVTVTLNQPQIDALVRNTVAPMMRRQQQEMEQIRATMGMRHMLMGGFMHAHQHGQWPEDIQALARALGAEDEQAREMLRNPRFPEKEVGYIYIRPPAGAAHDPQRVVLYEDAPEFGAGVYVGFADGRVERIEDEPRFRQLVQQAQGN